MKQLAIIALTIFTFAACDKQLDYDFTTACANVTGSSMIERSDNCKTCCRNNGYDLGSYDELRNSEGCGCANEK